MPKKTKIKEIQINFYPRKYEKSKLNVKVMLLFIHQILLLSIKKIFIKKN